MKSVIRKLFLAPVLIAELAIAPGLQAQNFKTLYSFTLASGLSSSGYSVNSDGRNPYAGLTISGNTLAGTANSGGDWGWGTVFGINTDGTGFTPFYPFSQETYIGNGISTNSDGGNPQAALVVSGNALYGTASQLGHAGSGTVFALSLATGFAVVHSFSTNVLMPNQTNTDYYTNSDGANPEAGLILSGSTLFGTAENGGTNGSGTVFKVNTDGTSFTNLHNFTVIPHGSVQNSDGAYPLAGLVLSGNALYGTASGGGTNGNGTVFTVSINGTGFTNLHSFSALVSGTNSDGANPQAGLVVSGNTLYGTARGGGTNGTGTVFSINTNGSGFTTLHSFMAGATDPSITSNHAFTNSDGTGPVAGLLLSGNALYGTASGGGTNGDGTVFAVNINGTGFQNLYTFSAVKTNSTGVYTNSDGANPFGGLILSSNILYGTATFGGNNGDGTVFSLLLAGPRLSIAHSGTNVILTWPTNATSSTLEFATNLVSPTVWNTNLPAPVSLNGQFAVTNPISGTQKFYRLSQ
jgi:uncharacterized repeat protein (TIGR03803 family)